MLGRMRSGAMLAALAMMGAASLPSMGAPPPTIMRAPVASKKQARRIFNLPNGSAGYGRKGAGISMAQQKRTAAKRRNVARNRRNHR